VTVLLYKLPEEDLTCVRKGKIQYALYGRNTRNKQNSYQPGTEYIKYGILCGH
jgi:hypothetical protein